MGVRLYAPTTGRFLPTDPVPEGNANAYDYCTADPVNCYDLNGQWSFHWRTFWGIPYGFQINLNKSETKEVAWGTGTAGGFLGLVESKIPWAAAKALAYTIRWSLWTVTAIASHAVLHGRCLGIGANFLGWGGPLQIFERGC